MRFETVLACAFLAAPALMVVGALLGVLPLVCAGAGVFAVVVVVALLDAVR